MPEIPKDELTKKYRGKMMVCVVHEDCDDQCEAAEPHLFNEDACIKSECCRKGILGVCVSVDEYNEMKKIISKGKENEPKK